MSIISSSTINTSWHEIGCKDVLNEANMKAPDVMSVDIIVATENWHSLDKKKFPTGISARFLCHLASKGRTIRI
jgi:hypothetical protein